MLSFKLVLWISHFPFTPCSLLGYAYCNGRCFAAGVIMGAVRRAVILSEASGWALVTAWRSPFHGINRGWLLNRFKWYRPADGGDCVNLFLGTCSCDPTHEREAAARSVPLAKKAGIWCADRTNLKTWCRKPCFMLSAEADGKVFIALMRNSWMIFSLCQ